ncbi:16194_t:CDS:2 [Gigaspora rosea]|nr:16194_t:CDS:2 [Gigaspora rosea]
MRNSSSKQDFEFEWELLINSYPTTRSYLEKTLYSTKKRWALAWISNRFTAEVQSTQHVEGINGIIKSNPTNRTTYAKPTHIPASAQLLPEVDKWLSKFLTPPILALQRVEIAEALWYSAILVSKKDININMLQEKNKIGFYEDLDDFLATKLDEVITNLSTLHIQKVWETTYH